MIRVEFFRLLRAILNLLLLAFVSLSAPTQTDTGAIVGQIRISRGAFPSERIQITLQTRGIVVNQAWTDNEGKFIFHGLPSNLYHIIISDEKYEPYQEDVRVDPHINPTNILSINLRPKDLASSVSNQTVTGGNPYLIDLTEYEKRFPKKVVKEFERGADSQAEGKHDEAIHYFQSALKLAPNFYPAHNNLGTVYLSMSNFEQAQAEFEAVLKIKQSDTEAYFNLGNVFLLTQRYEEALHMVEEGLRRQPNSGFGEFLLGSVYERQARMNEAERALRDAIRLDPGLARAHLGLVNLYLRQQRTREAADELRFFLKNFPADPLVAHARQVLLRLRSDDEELSNRP
jgi:tetratricopeptide (TPR) repeat protein